MTKTSRCLQAVLGVTLAFFMGVAALAAQDKVLAPKPDEHQAGMTMAAKETVQAPGLPGWIRHLPADKRESATALWLTDGRAITGYKELITAKRHELDALMTLPGTDDKAVQALVKDIAANEEKLLNAEIAFRRDLEKAGIPAWGRVDFGKHRMMEHSMMMGGDGMKGMGMMGMMKGDKDKDEGEKKDGGHSGH